MPKASIQIHDTWMNDEMQREALQSALLAYNMFEDDSDIAKYLMKEFDKKHGHTWHCIVGSYVGYYVDPKQGCYINFSIDEKRITLFKSK